jgi:hypothetical protein
MVFPQDRPSSLLYHDRTYFLEFCETQKTPYRFVWDHGPGIHLVESALAQPERTCSLDG